MSADNWAICPICKKKSKKKRKEIYDKKYGKVSAEKYNELMDQFRDEEGKFYKETVREDYNGGPGFDDEGNWYFEGHASCEVCGTEWNIDIKSKPYIPKDDEDDD